MSKSGKAKLINLKVKEEISKGREVYRLIGSDYKSKTVLEANKQHFSSLDAKIVSIRKGELKQLNSFLKIDDLKLIPYTS